MSRGWGAASVADAGAFLARLTRIDPAAVVRLRPVPDRPGRVALWAHLPWGVLVTRTIAGDDGADVTVAGKALLAELSAGGDALPPRRDQDWRWPLPPARARVIEKVPAADIVQIGAAAAETLRSVGAGAPGGHAPSRAVRDALLDHVAIVATAEPEPAPGPAGRSGAGRVEVSQRLVQGVVRMGFLGADGPAPEGPVGVLDASGWVGLAAPYGTAWLRPATALTLRPHS